MLGIQQCNGAKVPVGTLVSGIASMDPNPEDQIYLGN